MATKSMELMLEQADYHRLETQDGKVNEYVTVRPRIRGDVEQNREAGNAGFYPAGKPGKSSQTKDKQQSLSVDKFNKLMEKSGNELRIDENMKESQQLVGKDTPDDKRPVMKAAMQGYKTEKTEDGKIKKAPSSNPKDIEVYRMSMKSVEKSDFPEFSKEEHHKGISETNKARRLEQEKQKEEKEQEAPQKDEAEAELPFD